MKHDTTFDPRYGEAVELVSGIRRVTAPNPGPFTFHGTNTYLLGQTNIVIVDPGPASEDHLDALMKATEGQTVEAILVTHTHMDHSPAAETLKLKTGAPVLGCATHSSARDLLAGEINPLDASNDKAYAPDQVLADGETVNLAGIILESVATPGHTANHLAFSLADEPILISGDHVMAWSTSIVAPPDGSMRDYMRSLDRLLTRDETVYLPGHGTVLTNAPDYVEHLKQHRLARESAVLQQLGTGSKTVRDIVTAVYSGLDPALHGAAGLSVFAQLEFLVDKGRVTASPALHLEAVFELIP